MKKINHYFPNVILSVIFVFSFIGLSLTTEAKDKLLSSSFYISSAEKHDIYLRVTNHADDYFTKSYAVSGIPAEVYMDGLDDKTIKDAVDGKIENFFDYVSGKSSKIEETEIDFSVLEKNLTLIAMGLSLGIGKRELMEDYYLDEIGAVAEAWNALRRPPAEDAEEAVTPEAFFGGEGERL